jgi:hypothetical protein
MQLERPKKIENKKSNFNVRPKKFSYMIIERKKLIKNVFGGNFSTLRIHDKNLKL